MALGGGTFIAQNKILPGSYINFVSLVAASASLSDRGVAALGVEMDWGAEGSLIELTAEDFMKKSFKIFGHEYGDDALKGLRDLFLNARKVFTYRLNSGGTKASNTFATALWGGTRGNDLKTIIKVNVDDNTKFDVITVLGSTEVDKQTVASAAGLVDNDFCTFNSGATLAVTAGTAFTGGTNGTASSTQHQDFLDKLESKSFNALGAVTTEATIKTLYATYTARLRDEVGKKFQCVLYAKAADYEGVINVKNTVSDVGANGASMVYWTTGKEAAKPINASATNDIYDGEFSPVVNYTQSQLESAIQAGEFVFHQVDDDIRVLTDINSLVTTSDTKGDIFKDNQTIRVIDQIANDIAVLFNTRYLGSVPNDHAGRVSLWSDIVKHHKALQDIRAIEDFSDSDVTVDQGDTKKAVVVSDSVTIVNTMEKLYMTVYVS
jgi:hypothetical protein